MEQKEHKILMEEYYHCVVQHLAEILASKQQPVQQAAQLLADQIAADQLIHVVGPGGHSNLGTQEVFFRAGGCCASMR